MVVISARVDLDTRKWIALAAERANMTDSAFVRTILESTYWGRR